MVQQGLNSLFSLEDITIIVIWERWPHPSMFRSIKYYKCAGWYFEYDNNRLYIARWYIMLNEVYIYLERLNMVFSGWNIEVYVCTFLSISLH